MFYHPEFIVYLWLFPVVFLIIVPAVLKTGCVLYRTLFRSQAAVPSVNTEKYYAMQTGERRKHPRLEINGAFALVAGTGTCCSAMVDNISKLGICLRNLPQELMNEAEKFKVIVDTQAGNYEFLVNPKWAKKRESGHRIGAEITPMVR